MPKKINILFVLLFLMSALSAQEEEAYPPKPKHRDMELGLSFGYNRIQGDVYHRMGFGLGLHIRRDINHALSWQVQGVYGHAYGMDDRHATFRSSGVQVGSASLNPYGGQNSSASFYRNYKTENIWLSGHIMLDIVGLIFPKEDKAWRLYFLAGPSLYYYNGAVNMFYGEDVYRNGNGDPGFELIVMDDTGQFFWQNDLDDLRDYLDNSYETEILYYDGNENIDVRNQANKLNLLRSSKAAMIPAVDLGIGLGYKFGSRFGIAIEHQTAFSFFSGNDDLDGYNPLIYSNTDADIPHFTSLKFNYYLN